MGFDPSSFSARRTDQWSTDFDGIEVANGCPVEDIERSTMPDWFSFLNHGIQKWATASTDSHHAGFGEMGIPMTFVRMPTDDPAKAKPEDLRLSMKGGHMVISCGPFLGMKIGTADIGDVAKVSGDLLTINARVAAPSWMDLTQLEVVVNGELRKVIPLESTAAGDRFNGTITASITPGRDGWVILRTRGARPLGEHSSGGTPYGFTNPIFIDGNDDGRWVMTQ
jgi:hypothetical protein